MGSKIIDSISKDLTKAFPKMKGFSRRNLFYMRRLAAAYEDPQIVQQLAAQLPWGHNIVLLDRLEDASERIWYAQKTIEHSWSRNSLNTWIDSKLYHRKGKGISNFKKTLPKEQSDLAHQLLKDPYSFEFLAVNEDAKEKDLEQALINQVHKFLLELGKGYAFVGRQFKIEIDDEEYFIDLLFYNYILRCFVVIELKNTRFKPDFVGKLNFYQAAIDDMQKQAEDNPTIGILICQSKNNLTVEYALRYSSGPIGVSSFKTKNVEQLPKDFKKILPTPKDLKQNIEKDSN